RQGTDAGEPAPADPAAQREADAEQRARMQEALDAGGADRPEAQPPGAGAAEPGREADERRQANEAWLRRLPDDPGGLLRAKFRLEHERRRREAGR
ncbi:hypothetical protein H0E82_02240, partial [Luteimonas sp. SJ-16]|nr:hypothetical protein [Luteimonas deserti]